MNRRRFLSLGAALPWFAAARALAAAPPSLAGADADPYFAEWLGRFYVEAVASGLPPELLDRELSGLAPDPRIAALDARQPEFAEPISTYVENALGPKRVAEGRSLARSLPDLGRIESRYGVPREILVAVWAMESNFGVQQGDFDIIRSLATLAQGRRRDWANTQLIAALRMIADGDVTRARLRGSWAGAMGQTQILPTVYLSTAVTAAGAGKPDIWSSPVDALATAAHLLANDGWMRGQGWAVEVLLPIGFDYGLAEGDGQNFAWWARRGVRRAPGARWRLDDPAAAAVLLLPCGALGPAFLALPNHFAIRAYNDSIAYALAVGRLADRFAGGGPLATPWPHEAPLSLDQRMGAQAALARLGFNPGPADGMIGAGTRKALRQWQKSVGLPADGYLSAAMVRRLSTAAKGA